MIILFYLKDSKKYLFSKSEQTVFIPKTPYSSDKTFSQKNSMSRFNRSKIRFMPNYIYFIIFISMQESLVPNRRKSLFAANDSLRIFFFEMIGTFILSFGIVCSQYVPPLKDKIPNPFHDIFVSLSLYLAIIICGPLTGGHFNPSVTIGFYFLQRQKMKTSRMITFVLGQLAGAAIGVILAKEFFDCSIIPYSGYIDNLFTLIGHGIGQMLGAFLFILMILVVVHTNTTFTVDASWVQMFIPTTLFVARSFSYNIGGVNPAVVSMLQIAGVITQDIVGISLVYVLILDIFSLFGAYCACQFYQKIHTPAFEKASA